MIKAEKVLALAISTSAVLTFGLTFPDVRADVVYPPAHLFAGADFAPAGAAAHISQGPYYRPAGAHDGAANADSVETLTDAVSVSTWYRAAR